ncbi:NifB/NifX family molybdenum-iron cluster-binding protein [Thermodesulfobacteriota bacterium]
MRIAIAADSMDPTNAGLAPSLGMAGHILILDRAGNVFDSIDREPDPRATGTAFEAASALKEKEVDLLLTTQCEPFVKDDLRSSGIEVEIVRANSVRSALEDFKRSESVPRRSRRPEASGKPENTEDGQGTDQSRTSSLSTEAQRIAEAVEAWVLAREAKVAKKNEHLARVLDKYVKADGRLLVRYEQFEKHQQPLNMALLLALVEFLIPKVQFRDVMGELLKDIEELEKETEKAEARAGEAKTKAQEAFARAKRAEEKAEEAEALVESAE